MEQNKKDQFFTVLNNRKSRNLGTPFHHINSHKEIGKKPRKENRPQRERKCIMLTDSRVWGNERGYVLMT